MLSSRSQAALIEVLATASHAEIGTAAVSVGLADGAQGYTRHDRSVALVKAIFRVFNPGEASRLALDVANMQLGRLLTGYRDPPAVAVRLRDALAIDGFAYDNGRLIPATPDPTAIQEQLSLLEGELQTTGLAEASVHYRQAADSYVAGNHEAANGQVRSFIESLFKGLCDRRTGRSVADAGAALHHLRSHGWLVDREWNHLRSFWADIQDNGPHNGLSSANEALFRLHCATAVARYLLAKA